MKKLLLLALLFSTNRVERLSYIDVDQATKVEVFHDKESGIEILCVEKMYPIYGGGYATSISCNPTGRKW